MRSERKRKIMRVWDWLGYRMSPYVSGEGKPRPCREDVSFVADKCLSVGFAGKTHCFEELGSERPPPPFAAALLFRPDALPSISHSPDTARSTTLQRV